MGQSPEELRRDIELTRVGMSENLDAIGDRVSPGRIMERRRNRLRAGWTSLRGRVMGTPEDTTGTVAAGTPSGSGIGDRVGGAGEALRSAPETARQQAQGNPLLAGAVAFGAGFAAAAIFKGSETEAQAAQRLKEAAEPLKEEATSIAREVASSVQESGQQAAEQLKESATQSAEQVKQTAQAKAEETKEAGTSAAAEVKDQASSSAQQVKDQPRPKP